MSFLRRLVRGNAPNESAAQPAASATRPVVDGRGVIFVGIACPYCGVDFETPPARSRKCPACGQHVAYDRRGDDLVRLVRDGEKLSEVDYQEEQRARDRQFADRDPRPMRRLNSARLGTYAALGIHVMILNGDTTNVVVIGGSEPEERHGRGTARCRPCRQLDRSTYPAGEAPLLPFAGCESGNRICVCRYQPFLPSG